MYQYRCTEYYTWCHSQLKEEELQHLKGLLCSQQTATVHIPPLQPHRRMVIVINQSCCTVYLYSVCVSLHSSVNPWSVRQPVCLHVCLGGWRAHRLCVLYSGICASLFRIQLSFTQLRSHTLPQSMSRKTWRTRRDGQIVGSQLNTANRCGGVIPRHADQQTTMFISQ